MTKGEFLELPKISDLTERDCQILGAIGQVGVLGRLSGYYESYRAGLPQRKDEEPAYAVGRFMHGFKPGSISCIEGKIDRAAHNPHESENIIATARELNMLHNRLLRGITRLALRYHCGEVPHDIAPETEDVLLELTDYYTDRAAGLVEVYRSQKSPIFEERKIFGAIPHEIAYYVKSG